MGILKELLEELKTDSNVEKIRELCGEIFEQEKSNIENALLLPKGPNIFLSLEVPGRNQSEIAFLCLERESEDIYLLVLFVIRRSELNKSSETVIMKKQRVWEINDHRPEKILTEYAKQYKYLRGE